MSESLTVKKTVKSPVEKVYQAFVDEGRVKQWFCPENMQVPEAKIDARKGGAFRVVMEGEDGKHTATGKYTEVEPNKKLVFSWQWEGDDHESQITVEFNKVSDEETEVVLTHEMLADEKSKEMHAQGWQSTLDNLVKHLS